MKLTKTITCVTLSALLLVGCSSSGGTTDLGKFKTEVLELEDAPRFMELDSDTIAEMIQLSTDDYVSAAAFVPMMNVQATEIMLFTYETDAQKQSIVEALDNRMKTLEETWSTYLPEQYEFVQNHDVIDENQVYGYIIGEEAFKQEVKNALSNVTE